MNRVANTIKSILYLEECFYISLSTLYNIREIIFEVDDIIFDTLCDMNI